MRHDALRRAVRVSSRRTTVECEHNLYLACEDSPQRAFFFCTTLVLFLPTWLLSYIYFVAFSFSVLPTVGCV